MKSYFSKHPILIFFSSSEFQVASCFSKILKHAVTLTNQITQHFAVDYVYVLSLSSSEKSAERFIDRELVFL